MEYTVEQVAAQRQRCHDLHQDILRMYSGANPVTKEVHDNYLNEIKLYIKMVNNIVNPEH